MIKANELRIGNWIICFTFVLEDEDDNYNHKVTGEDIYRIEDRDTGSRFAGIILTEEWLIKFGFEKKGDTYNWHKKTTGIDFDLSVGFGGYRFILGHNPLEIDSRYNNDKPYHITDRFKCVHQLQNLYFALTGEELTVE